VPRHRGGDTPDLARATVDDGVLANGPVGNEPTPVGVETVLESVW
jgi:hypothetical protein